jgi:uncharacterized protein DUF6111
MLRLVEVALFLAPFALFLLWRLLVPASGPSRTMIAAAAAALLVLVASLIWLRRQEAEPAIAAYVPSRLEGDRILPPAASVPAGSVPAGPVSTGSVPAASAPAAPVPAAPAPAVSR